jgi:hypothetical protein
MKGNFKTKKHVEQKETEEKDRLEEQFERTALKRLGGSIAFVSKKGFTWDGDDGEGSGTESG